jgi:hypothetical protein
MHSQAHFLDRVVGFFVPVRLFKLRRAHIE